MEAQLARAKELAEGRPAEAAELYRAVCLAPPAPGAGEAESLKHKEAAVTALAALLARQGDAQGLSRLAAELAPLFEAAPKAKTAKLVRLLLDAVASVPGSDAVQRAMCESQRAWCRASKRTFLRHRVELRLASLHAGAKDYAAALPLITSLLTEVKRLDDKLLLVDVHLLESKGAQTSARVHHALRNLAKSKAALTAGRTAANAIYVPPSVQALLDLQSGVLHAEEKDYKTGYSYFVEAFEALTGLGDGALAGKALKYMLLCKVMTGSPEDVPSLASSKGGLAHQGAGLDAMVAVASASAARSLRLLQKALEDYEPQLAHDEVVASHLEALRDTLLERNLVRIIEPYSRVELSHVARLIELPLADVERKLGQMLLDKAFAGTLDQGQGCLLVYDAQPPDGAYKAALETIANLERVVDSLAAKSARTQVS